MKNIYIYLAELIVSINFLLISMSDLWIYYNDEKLEMDFNCTFIFIKKI